MRNNRPWGLKSSNTANTRGYQLSNFQIGRNEANYFKTNRQRVREIPIFGCWQSGIHPRCLSTRLGGRSTGCPMITSSAQTKRPVFKPAAENNQRYRRHPIVRRTLSMSTSAWVPRPIWQPGMSIEQKSSVAVKLKVELLPSIGLWTKSWDKSPTNLLAASFGFVV